MGPQFIVRTFPGAVIKDLRLRNSITSKQFIVYNSNDWNE